MLAGCAGYRVGARSLYPADVRTVYVPMFESASFRRGLGERLTEAVMKEIELKTPFKVVGTPNADSVLSGRILADRKNVVVESPTDEPRELEFGLLVEVRWLDRQGDLIQPAQTIALPVALTTVDQAASIVPEFGRSIATGQQEAIQEMAEQIVSLMEAPW